MSRILSEPSAGDSLTERRFLQWAGAIFAIGLLLRVMFFLAADVENRLAGDIAGYWNYASNLAVHHVFSMAGPGISPVPDAYRGPGFPLFLSMFAGSGGAQALVYATWGNMLLGAIKVLLTIALARQWLGRTPALVAGGLVAFWPHLVVFSSTLLSETFFGASLLTLLLVAAMAAKRDSRRMAVAAGGLGALCCLTNPIALLLPVLIGASFLRAYRRLFLGLHLAFALTVLAWSARGATLPPGPNTQDRAWTNVAQGSWPLFHAAYNEASRDPMAQSYLDRAHTDEVLLQRDPMAGLQSLAGRFRSDPGYYSSWYLVEKPFLLWDWSVRIGWGDIYFLQTRNSPIERNSALRTIERVFKALNPAVFATAAALVALLLVSRLRRRVGFSLGLVAFSFVYLTTAHVFFQAEPRYSVAYRPLEIILFVTALSWMLVLVLGRGTKRGQVHPASPRPMSQEAVA
jgi:hypothetical protein